MKSNNVIIIDYGLGNLFSINQALLKIGITSIITSNKKLISAADFLILPGVGAFGDAMYQLNKLDLIAPIIQHSEMNKPLLGICLGMQLLLTESEEFGKHKGMGIINGYVRKFPSEFDSKKIRVPQIGWNSVYCGTDQKWHGTPLMNIKQNESMYFVHSYYAMPDNKSEIMSLTNYEGFEYCSSVKKQNTYGFQFHPEKSSQKGLTIYSTMFELIKSIKDKDD